MFKLLLCSVDITKSPKNILKYYYFTDDSSNSFAIFTSSAIGGDSDRCSRSSGGSCFVAKGRIEKVLHFSETNDLSASAATTDRQVFNQSRSIFVKYDTAGTCPDLSRFV